MRSVGDLPAGIVDVLVGLPDVAALATVRSGALLLTASADDEGEPVDGPRPGWGIPVDVAAIDSSAYAAVLDRDGDAIADLQPGQALLGETSARLRRLGPGATLTLGDRRLDVAGVVADHLVGSSEIVVHRADAAALGIGGVRYVLARVDGEAGVEAVQQAVADVPRVLSRDLGHAPWPTAWREVLPQAVVKERFGEFAIRPGNGRSMQQEPGWADEHVVTAPVPLLGEVRCHRRIIAPLRAALGELEARGLGSLVDPADYAGCFSPRLIGAGAGPSRHAWGLAVDLNASRNPFGAPSQQDPRLVEIMERHDFGFGGRWPVPDAMHFEYRGP